MSPANHFQPVTLSRANAIALLDDRADSRGARPSGRTEGHAPAASKLKVLDLFSGIGGFSLGLERTGGFETVAFCEIEEYPRKVLAKHWPDVPCYSDVRELTGERLAADGIAVDVICGGFPCQDLSTAGNGSGLRGERSGLWSEYARLVREVRPGFVIVENSPELLDGWLGDVLGPLASLGYDAEWECIPAASTGAPHIRDRMWIIAHAASLGLSGQGGLLNAIHPAPDTYREASGLVDAVQGGSMPFLCGRHDGVPSGMAQLRLHALGNAVVPAIPELIGNAILHSLNHALHGFSESGLSAALFDPFHSTASSPEA